jgi:hypothetical protein
MASRSDVWWNPISQRISAYRKELENNMGDCLCPYEVCSIHGDNVIRHGSFCDKNHDTGELCNTSLIKEGIYVGETNESVLQEAERIINGQRRTDYGGAKASFERIAGLFSAYLGIGIDAHDVAMLMVLLKVARSKQGIMNNGEPQRDSLVDIAGYAGCSEKISRDL